MKTKMRLLVFLAIISTALCFVNVRVSDNEKEAELLNFRQEQYERLKRDLTKPVEKNSSSNSSESSEEGHKRKSRGVVEDDSEPEDNEDSEEIKIQLAKLGNEKGLLEKPAHVVKRETGSENRHVNVKKNTKPAPRIDKSPENKTHRRRREGVVKPAAAKVVPAAEAPTTSLIKPAVPAKTLPAQLAHNRRKRQDGEDVPYIYSRVDGQQD